MTTITLPRATVEQALEALKYLRDTAICSADTDAANEVIPDLEAALAQQAEPVQEPVGEVAAIDFSEESGPEAIVTLHQDVELGTMLYTAPPQRKPLTEEEIAAEWQKASECAGKSEAAVTASQFVQMFARAVERAHGIKE